MKIMLVAAVEDDANLLKQVRKQTMHHDFEYVYIDRKPAQGITNRRVRIANNHSYLRTAVLEEQGADLIWQLEGDVVLPEDTLERLVDSYHSIEDDNKAYVSAVQVGRHGVYMLGAWHIYDDSYESIDYRLEGIHSVDGTGFYCLLANRTAWLDGTVSWNGEPWGPDVNFGLSLKKLEYNIYADLNIPIGHIIQRNGIVRGEIWPSDQSTCNVRFYKKNGKWIYKTS